MRRLATGLLMALALAGSAFAAGIADIPWNQSNIQTLRELDKPAVATLVNELRDTSGPVPRPKASEIGELTWADLGGNGQYQLVMILDINGRHFYNVLVVYHRDFSGRVTSQEVRGWAMRDLGKIVRDIDGDGKDELIVPTQLPSDTYRGAAGMAVWPAVYRLENGKYVEASHEFPSFYEQEVLPALEKEIAQEREKIRKGIPSDYYLAIAIMARDKILRVTGKDPTAGLREAREWMKSKEPGMRENAAAVLGDIGGYDDELRALAADKDPAVSRSARFAMSHGAGSVQRFNSAIVPETR